MRSYSSFVCVDDSIVCKRFVNSTHLKFLQLQEINLQLPGLCLSITITLQNVINCTIKLLLQQHLSLFLFKAIWKRLYSIKSANEKGTLYQLRNMLNRTSIPADPSASTSTSGDFLLLMLHSHVISTTNAVLIHNPMDSVMDLSAAIVSNFVCLLKSEEGKTDDLVHEYAKQLLCRISLAWFSRCN